MGSTAFWSAYWLTHMGLVATLAAANSGLFSSNRLVRYYARDLSTYGKTMGAAGNAAPRLLRVPKRWFTHFYVVGTLMNLGLLLSQGVVELTMALYQFHVMRRLYESLYISRFSPSARMHVAHYLLGVTYYVAVPLTLQSCSGTRPNRRLLFIGIAAFLAGSIAQHRCHCILASLRPAMGAGGTSYKIPRGGCFELVSCPHYAAEVLIYGALALFTPGAGAAWALTLFVVVELSYSALSQHEWYQKSFENYPPRRKAIFPYLL